MFELFLDDKGQKISKSKGNGITIDEWLTYGPAESLALFMFQKPRAAKRLYFDVIPKAVDDYIALLEPIMRTKPATSSGWKIRSGISMAAMCRTRAIRSASRCCSIWCRASNAHDRDVLWGFIRAYAPERVAGDQSGPGSAGRLCAALLRGFREAGQALSRARRQGTRGAGRSGRAAGEAGRRTRRRESAERGLRSRQAHGFEPLRDWFEALYEVLFGQTAGTALRFFRRPVRLRARRRR